MNKSNSESSHDLDDDDEKVEIPPVVVEAKAFLGDNNKEIDFDNGFDEENLEIM